jgi:hypothetical protein
MSCVEDLVQLYFKLVQQEKSFKSKISNLEINYPDAIKKSILFYEAQRSGILPETNRIPWRHDSFLLDLGPMKEKLHGGYFDAGDHMKFTFPMAFSMTILSWGVLQDRLFNRVSCEFYLQNPLLTSKSKSVNS